MWKILRELTQNLFESSPTSNIVVGYSLDIKKICRLWSMSGRPSHSMAELFFKNCQKFWQKSTKNDPQHKLCDAKYCAVWVQIIYLRQILYTHTDFLQKGYPLEMFPAETGGSSVTMWSLLCEKKQNFHIKFYLISQVFAFLNFLYMKFFWGRFWTPFTAVVVPSSAGNSFRRVEIKYFRDMYLSSGHLILFLICTHQAHYIDNPWLSVDLKKSTKKICFQKYSKCAWCVYLKISNCLNV